MRILFLMICFLTFGVCYGQQVKLQITSTTTTNGGAKIQVVGSVSDDLAKWGGTDFSVGDYLYVVEGSDVLEIQITDIVSSSSSNITFKVSSSVGGVPTGQAALLKRTDKLKLTKFVSGLRNDLQAEMGNIMVGRIDENLPKYSDDLEANNNGVTVLGTRYKLKLNNPYGKGEDEIRYYKAVF